MLPVGVATTDRNGFIMQTAVDHKDTDIRFDAAAKSLIVTHKTPTDEIDQIHEAYKALDQKDDPMLVTRLTAPEPTTCPVDRAFTSTHNSPEIEGLNTETIDDAFTKMGFFDSDAGIFSDPRFLLKNHVRYDGRENFSIFKREAETPYKQILINMIYYGYSSDRQKKIDALKIFKEKEKHPKLGRVNQHYFLPSNEYGFMLYPIDRGPVATGDLTTLTERKNDRQVAKKGQVKAIAESTEKDHVTIALHCTLPEWDRRLNEKLKNLLYAQKALRLQMEANTHSLTRFKQLQTLFDSQARFGKDMDFVEKFKHESIAKDLEEVYEHILDKTTDSKNHKDLRLSKAMKAVDDAADELWKLLKSEFLSKEIHAYRVKTMPTEHAESETDGVADPGPDMEVEPFWSHIHETLSKCYSAFQQTSLAEKVWTSQVAPYFIEIAKKSGDIAASPKLIDTFENLDKAKVYLEPTEGDKKIIFPKKLSQRTTQSELTGDIGSNILPEPQDTQANTWNPLKEIPLLYLKGAGALFHNVPGPPSLCVALLDTYYTYLTKLSLAERVNENETTQSIN